MMIVKKNMLLLGAFVLALAGYPVAGQPGQTLYGYVRDAANGEGLVGASVRLKSQPTGVATNAYGYFSLTVPSLADTLVISYIGFRSQALSVAVLKPDQAVQIRLVAAARQMDEVMVSANESAQRIHNLEMGTTRLDLKTLKILPTLLGEVDLVRSLQLLPGVTSVGEGAAGFNVRGGGVGQNLILLDEAPVYNASHLMGFFTVVNPDAVKEATLSKGGVPAQYGGRLSSVLDVRMKEGNTERFQASGGVGTISSRLTIEGPLGKGRPTGDHPVRDHPVRDHPVRGSFLVAGRRSYSDLVVGLSGDEQLRKNSVYFYDLSAKVNYQISAKDRVYGSLYSSKDVFRVDFQGKKVDMEWMNQTGTLRWNHLFSKRLFANLTGVYSAYSYQLGIPQEAQGDISLDLPKGIRGAVWTSAIRTYNLKTDFTFYAGYHNTLTFGGSFLRYRFDPGSLSPTGNDSPVEAIALPAKHSREYAFYIDNEQTLGTRWALRYGLRFSVYDYLGPQRVRDYVNVEKGPKQPVNEQIVGRGAVIRSFNTFEPRVSLRYVINERNSIKLSYNRMAQYIHLISNTTAASPLDNWTPSTNNIQPERADQVSAGYFRTLSPTRWEASAEVYYKNAQNAIDYRNGAQTRLNPDLEADLLYGRGRSYGLEVYVRKASGRLTGWLSYTLSRTEQQIDGISNNTWYAASQDRRHVGSAVGTYTLSKRWSGSATFTYSTGIATTAPNARYEADGGTIVVPINTGNVRNNFRLPPYHRLDLSATWQGRSRPDRRWRSEWVFGFYNVYARRNPFSIYFEQNDGRNTRQTNAVRLAILGSILPSVTYNFHF
ncbi:TonB-dependent receptor [Fibrisoma montanum]|uniref:TonB-dependent receptor n=1 Tax=Fibrisoma montanum TaxID=2305895 RepID=A0A418MC25_9BACT|nr:TonB-dependent receptor [Fibrisoma montanum]RIV23932.1 TonB-dependent receptor [Fibrisoma montanum]